MTGTVMFESIYLLPAQKLNDMQLLSFRFFLSWPRWGAALHRLKLLLSFIHILRKKSSM